MPKITFADKTNKTPITDRPKQICAEDLNEIKQVINQNYDENIDGINREDYEVLRGKYDFKRFFDVSLNAVYRTEKFNYPLLAGDVLNLKFEFTNITNIGTEPRFDFGCYEGGSLINYVVKYFSYSGNDYYTYEVEYTVPQDCDNFGMIIRGACGSGNFRLTISNKKTLLDAYNNIEQLKDDIKGIPHVSEVSQYATISRNSIASENRKLGAILTRINSDGSKVIERFTGNSVNDWLNPTYWKNIELTSELINEISMGDDLASCNITFQLSQNITISDNKYTAVGQGISIYPRMQGFLRETLKAGHKYFITFKRFIDYSSSGVGPNNFIFMHSSSIINEYNPENQSTKVYDTIFTPDSEISSLVFRFNYGVANYGLGTVMEISDFMVFDLTDFYGIGNEPTKDFFRATLDDNGGYFDGSIELFYPNDLEQRVVTVENSSIYRKRDDMRYLKDSPVRELEEKMNKYQNTIQSLRKIKTAGAGELSLNIANQSGVEKKDVLIRLYLHKGSKPAYADETNFDVWMNDSCNEDFSDIRFLDNNGNLLDCYKNSHGNYALIPDSSIGTEVSVLSDGSFVKRSSATESSVSTDNGQTWTKLIDGLFVGESANGDIFFYAEYGSPDLYKATKASNFQTTYLVMNANAGVQEWFLRNFVIDDLGYIFLGEYKEGSPSRVFRSIDNGESFQLSYEKATLEHVHSLFIDRNVIPNRVYANNDGQYSGEGPSTYYTDDRGATWVKYPFVYSDGTEFVSDYGVFYADASGFTLGGGEGGIKGTPTVFKTVDGVSESKLKVMQNSHWLQKLGNAFFCGATAYKFYNRYPQIYRSDDEGETWKAVNFIPYTDENGALQYGYRFGTLQPLLLPDGQYCHTVGSWIPGYPALRIIEGGDNHQAMFIVKLPTLPAAGTTIKIGYGYLAEDVEGKLYSDKITTIDSLLVRYKLNEFGAYMTNNLGDEEFINLPNNWIGGNLKHYGWLVPLRYRSDNAAVKFSETTHLPIKGFHKNKGFTINIWGRMLHKDEGTYFMFGRTTGDGNDMYFWREVGYRIKFKYGVNVINLDVLQLRETITHDAFMLTISISDDVIPLLSIYINGNNLITDLVLSGFDNNMDDSEEWRIGGAFDDKLNDENTYWTDLSVFEDVVLQDDVRIIYEGCNLIKI